MKIFKEIFGRILAIWTLLMFVLTMLVFLIPFMLFVYFRKDPLRTELFVKYSRFWIGTFFFLTGCSLKVRGKENFKKGETYIVVCNHNSFFDILIASPWIPGGNKTIAKIEMARIPLFNLLYKTGSVLVDRKSDRSRRESFTEMKSVLDMGLHMCIYPEGTRNKTREALKSFHNGAFKLALDTGKSIIPAVIFRTKEVLPSHKKIFMWPQQMEMHFLPAVDVQFEDDVESLKKKVFTIMKEYYQKNETSPGIQQTRHDEV
jgi:1-acyl-sn-glycerol-3-phosphate acyltransferase